MDLLAARREVIEQNVPIPRLQALRDWVRCETTLSKRALRAAVEKSGNEELRLTLAWSEAVDAAIEEIVKGVPPFPHVREALAKASANADILVVSQTPLEALEREWSEHRLNNYVRMIAGQEHGSKAEHLALAGGGHYPAERILMIGDAQGDLQAAQKNGVCFFPIVPGHEADAWKRFLEEGLDRFLSGNFRGAYEQRLLDAFDAALPEKPSW
jgi:phosphoglycolate phosphatase-like HAD superfamily hydrolase